MGEVGHVADYIAENYSSEGIEFETEARGVLRVSLPPNVRNIDKFYADIRTLEGVVAMDQEINNRHVVAKIMVSDNPMVEQLNRDTKPKVKVNKACRLFQGYIGSSSVFIVLLVTLILFYWQPILRFVEAAYVLSLDPK